MTSPSLPRPAVFLDRDGTIIDDAGYIDAPEKVRLLPGAAEAIKRFHRTGHLVVVVSNQSGVARGYFDEQAMQAVQARVESLLAVEGARLDGAYFCPYLNDPSAQPAYRRDIPWRKPAPGMLLQAATDLNIDLSRSWMIGDAPRDVQAGLAAGCRTILIHSNGVAPTDADNGTILARSLLDAADKWEQEVNMHETGLRLAKPLDDADSTRTPADARAPAIPPPDQGEPAPAKSADIETIEWLQKIHDLLDRQNRAQRHSDFSVLRLTGALLQMFAIVTAAWGLLALVDDQHAAATSRFALACFTQLAALCAFAVDRFR